MVPWKLECILLPGHWVRSWGHIQRKLGVRPGGKEVEMRMPKHTANPLEHPRKKGSLRGENLVEMTELVR